MIIKTVGQGCSTEAWGGMWGIPAQSPTLYDTPHQTLLLTVSWVVPCTVLYPQALALNGPVDLTFNLESPLSTAWEPHQKQT